MAERFCTSLIALVAVTAALRAGPAAAQDYSAGKTAAQLFQSDCTACHKSPAGLAKGMDSRALAGFLREHYTTKTESAAALAAYLAGGAGGLAEPKQKGQGPSAEPGTGPKPKSAARGESEAKPHAPAEPAPQRAEETESAPHMARPPSPSSHEGVKVDEATLRKLHFYSAAAGPARGTRALTETVRTLEFYASAGSPAGAIAPGEGASPTKPKPAEKKKKNSSSTATPPGPTPPAAVPGQHASAPRRAPAAANERHTGNN